MPDGVERCPNRNRGFLIPAEEAGQIFELSFAGAASRDAAGLVEPLAQLIGQGKSFARCFTRLDHSHRKGLNGLSRSFLCPATTAFAFVVRILDHNTTPLSSPILTRARRVGRLFRCMAPARPPDSSTRPAASLGMTPSSSYRPRNPTEVLQSVIPTEGAKRPSGGIWVGVRHRRP
jgi:hypothetical protein